MQKNKYKKTISFQEAIKSFSQDLIDNFKKEYNPKIGVKSVNNILILSKNIYENTIKNPGKNTLIVGNVQSGKTATYIGMISYFLNNNSNFCVVVPAIDNILFQQTFERIKEIFKFNVKVYRVVQSEILSDVTKKQIIQNLKDGKKIIILGLKNKKQISKITQLCKSVKNNNVIKNPFLIDDEGDQASFDNILETEKTATNSSIVELINVFNPRLSFFSITATPMAQIFVDNKADIKPDFAFITKPGDGYTGINYYHALAEEENNSIQIIPKSDVKKIKEGKVRPHSLKEALMYYFAAAAYLHSVNGTAKNTSFLIHTHRKILDHLKIEGFVNGELNVLRKKIQNDDVEYMKMLNEIIKNSVIKVGEGELPLFKELMLNHIDDSAVIASNQKNPKFKDVMRGNVNATNTIYIGSQMLQRGVTLPNLLVTYFAYRSKGTANCDTVLQRARWFGYRESYKELTKLYIDETSSNDFLSLSEMNEDLFERLEEMQNSKGNFKELFEQSILLPYRNNNMRATRETVALNGRNKQWRTYTNSKIKNEPVAEKLHERLESTGNLKTMLNGQKFKGLIFKTYKNAIDWMGEELEEIYKELQITGKYRKDLEDFFQRNKNMDFAIVIMNSKKNNGIRERKIIEVKKGEYKFSITQGNNIEKGGSYFGDRYWWKYKQYQNTFMFQIHKIQKKDSKDKTIYYKLLLVAPKKVVGELIHKKQVSLNRDK